MASIIFACESSEKVNAPDVSDIAVDVDIRRFEQALFSLDTNNMAAELKNLEEQFFYNRIQWRLLSSKLPSLVKRMKHPTLRTLHQFPQDLC